MELKIQNLSKHYGTKKALDTFSYTFQEGIYGILGANGAGKSTLMNLITDNVRRTEGSILYNGEEILRLGKKFRRQLGYMPQQQGLYEQFSARVFLLYMAEIKGMKRKQARAEVEQLLHLVNLEGDAHRKLGGFSGGMRQFLWGCCCGSPSPLIPHKQGILLQKIKIFHPQSKKFFGSKIFFLFCPSHTLTKPFFSSILSHIRLCPHRVRLLLFY